VAIQSVRPQGAEGLDCRARWRGLAMTRGQVAVKGQKNRERRCAPFWRRLRGAVRVQCPEDGAEHTTRNPMLSYRLTGLYLLR
jgi:hypothetical protein